MTRLDRLESLYLNILRITILILATLFLAGAVFGLATAVPKLLPSFGAADARKMVTGTTLLDYRNEQRNIATATSGDTPSDSQATSNKIDSRIVAAARNLVAWGTKMGNAYELPQVETFLDQKQKSLADSLQGDYADSLVAFSQDVLAYGRSGDDVNALVNWHLAKFSAAQAQATQADAERAAKTAIERQQAMILAGAAASAFLIFLILLFVFVLVKIERNLRIVTVQNADGGGSV